MGNKEVALGNEILRGVVGSTALGTALEGTDDRDEMGVFVEPAEYVCGLKTLDHYIQRDQPEGVRSQPGDLDLTLYSLRKYCYLAARGNPSVLILLWLPEYIKKTGCGQQLIDLREAFVSKEAGQRFLGYLVSQRMKLMGERSPTVSRPELVAKHGYDTKFAMHALRLGLEGIEYMTTGRLTLPTPEPDRATLMTVRRGEVTFKEALSLIQNAEATLRTLVDACEWKADMPRINRFLVDTHRHLWPRTASAAE